VVGATGASVDGVDSQGAVYLFSEANGVWTQTQELTSDDALADGDFGSAVALEGETLFVGAD